MQTAFHSANASPHSLEFIAFHGDALADQVWATAIYVVEGYPNG